MDVLEAIRTRRSVKRMTDVVPSRKDVEELIDAAVWAPNHRFTQPWRFFVVADAAAGFLQDDDGRFRTDSRC